RLQDVDQLGSCAEVEVLLQQLPARRERAFQVDDRDVRGLEDRPDAGEVQGNQLLARNTRGELLVEVGFEVVAERRVARGRDEHRRLERRRCYAQRVGGGASRRGRRAGLDQRSRRASGQEQRPRGRNQGREEFPPPHAWR